MKKLFSAVIAGAVCLGALAGCAEEKVSSSEKQPDTAVNADASYARLGVWLTPESLAELYQTDTDAALSAERQKVSALTLSDGKFKLPGSEGFEGSYTLEDGQVFFHYEKFLRDVTANGGKDADGQYEEYSADAFTFSDSDDVREMDIPHRTAYTMQYCNRSGSYIYGCNSFAEKCWQDWNYQYLPLFPECGAVSSYVGASEIEPECRLYSVDEFLCRKTAGVTLNGSYTTGEPFTISFNFVEHERNDPGSTYSYRLRTESEEAAEEVLSSAADYVISQLGTDSIDTVIEFEDGKWQWLDSSGSLINSGEYRESTEYSGFTVMYMTEDSPSYDGIVSRYDFAPLMFYISGDSIYCPEFIRQ